MKEELGLKRTLGDVLHGISICTQLRTIDMCTFVDNWFEMDPRHPFNGRSGQQKICSWRDKDSDLFWGLSAFAVYESHSELLSLQQSRPGKTKKCLFWGLFDKEMIMMWWKGDIMKDVLSFG